MERIEQELREVVGEMGRMPSAPELNARGLGRLATAALRNSPQRGRGAFAWWANRLGASLKDSCTKRGVEIENRVAEELLGLGLAVVQQTTRAPFDLLVENRVRVDVKSAQYNEYTTPKGGRCCGHFFGLSKADPTCDLYILCGVDAANAILWRYFVPSSEARVRTLTITPTGQTYTRFREDIGQLLRLARQEPTSKAA